MRQPERVIEDALAGFGSATFADVQCFPIGALELGSGTHLTGEAPAQCLPAVVDIPGFKLMADSVHEMVGEDRDKQVPAHPIGLVMINGPQTEFGFETAKDRLQIGQHGVGMP